MTIAEWCVFGAAMLTVATIGWAKVVGRRTYDNARPRDPGFYADPLRARLRGAHNNGHEAFAFFATAVLFAEFRGAPQATVDGLALAFIAVRVGYVIAYAADRATLRSLLWTAGFLINTAIFFAAVLVD